MVELDSLAAAAMIVSVAGLIPLYLDYFQRRRDRAVTFLLDKFQETVTRPISSNWSIRILNPNKLLEKCQIFWNDRPLPWWDSWDNPEERIYRSRHDVEMERVQKERIYPRTIVIGGGGNVRIPEGLELGDATITVKDGEKKLRARRFSDLPVGKR